ncbi:MAG: CPBP family intramembrane glutamic endopeptidase [Pedobacter sp.]|uniref:CPBP family intramembrane glutamic endopeptidase n=1 Tax=Pedobacter sp. TaxID=1411316 RepID=UPI00339736AA
MNFSLAPREEKSAYSQLLILACYALAGTIIGSVLSLAALVSLYGTSILQNTAGLSGGDPAYLNGLRIAQSLTSICLFLMPPVLLAITEKTRINKFYGFKAPRPFVLLVVFLIMLCSVPLMEWMTLLNQKMVLPDALKSVENWMREKEEAAMNMTILLLRIRGFGEFMVNIFIIALLPAAAEELLFRGGIQRSFSRMFNNPHVAIWVSAFIFSAIHVQFFGFFPRLFLGAAFGYIYLWTGSLWYAMFAHFLNNAYAVCQAWYLQVHHIPLDQADNSSYFPWYASVISLILSIFLFKYLKDKTKESNGEQLG